MWWVFQFVAGRIGHCLCIDKVVRTQAIILSLGSGFSILYCDMLQQIALVASARSFSFATGEPKSNFCVIVPLQSHPRNPKQRVGRWTKRLLTPQTRTQHAQGR